MTVAYIKAQVDDGADRLDSFLPLAIDAVSAIKSRLFATEDVQEVISRLHGLAMPRETVSTLLGRLTRSGSLTRESGRFRINASRTFPRSDISSLKAQLRDAQLALGEALQRHMAARGHQAGDGETGLELLLQFLMEQQVSVILGVPELADTQRVRRSESIAIAEFIQQIVGRDEALKSTLASILEGLVLYHASFLPDVADTVRRFNHLTVAFDTVLVRQALGYEGTAPRALLRETVELFRESGIRCVVFDKTVREIQRILRMYQDKLGTTEGRRSLRPGPMARTFLTERYSPSDVQEMSALLDGEIKSAGFLIVPTPPRVARWTAGEAELALRLADPVTHDVAEPRVEHDVDCVAAVLTMRAGHRSDRIEDARVVFATVSPLVIKNTRLWWIEDEGERAVAPIVHIRALANLAWLKRPRANAAFKVSDLITLCAAAMRPSPKVWTRFLNHLDKLRQRGELTQDAVTAIIVSAMSDELLRDAEETAGDPEDVDAGTLDEVVDRVMAEYSDAAETRVASAEAATHEMRERLRRRELEVDGRARGVATVVGRTVYVAILAVVAVASAAILLRDVSAGSFALVLAVVVVTGLQFSGTMGQLRAIRARVEGAVYRRARRLLLVEPLSEEAT